MQIISYETHQRVKKRGLEGVNYAIVIDVLRATSTMVTALHHHAKAIYPVSSIRNVKKLRTKHEYALCCGERGGVKIQGFDMGNSPRSYTKERVGGREIIITTTNGTKAIKKTEGAGVVLMGSLLNAKAVADAIKDKDGKTAIIMAGTEGEFSLDDALACGAILHHMGEGHHMDDRSLCCRALYERYKGNIMEGITQCSHAKRLIRLGYGEDVAYCAQDSVLSEVPRYLKGEISL